MKDNLIAMNDKTIFLVIDEINNSIILNTTDIFMARKMSRKNKNFFISEYPPFCYAAKKQGLGFGA